MQVAAFASDPIGWLVQRLQEAVHALGALVIPYVLGALEPDYTAEWWVTSYKVSFGISVLILAFLMIATAARRARGDIGPRALMESYFFAVPAFLVGASFGPLVGVVLTRLFVGLADSLALFFLDSSSSDFWRTFADRVSNPDASKLANSGIIAFLLYVVLIAALLGVVFILVIQLATQYLVGALIPLGLVWLTHPGTRRLAKVGPVIWLSILASHVLLILVLGIAFKATNALFLEAGDTATVDPMRTFVNIAVPTVLMALVVFAPMRLLGMARFTSPSNGGGQSSGGGLSTPAQSPQPGQWAMNAQQVAAKQSGGTASSSPASTPGAVNVSAAPTSSSVTAAAGGGASAAAATARAGAGAGAAAASTTGAAAAGGGAVAAAGAGTLATGVGAPIGMSLLVMDAALKVAHRASQAAEQAAGQAADAGDERD